MASNRIAQIAANAHGAASVNSAYFSFSRHLKLIFGNPGSKRGNASIGLFQFGLVVIVLLLEGFYLFLAIIPNFV